jgi:Leucine-rich repeat (LRR) protein
MKGVNRVTEKRASVAALPLLADELWCLIIQHLDFETQMPLTLVSSQWRRFVYATVTSLSTVRWQTRRGPMKNVSLDDETLARFGALTALDLDLFNTNNCVTAAGVVACTKLTCLDISWARADRFAVHGNLAVSRLRHLTELNLNECQSKVMFEDLAQLTNMTSLGISHTSITFAGISTMTSLTFLNISGCHIRDEELLHFSKLQTLVLGDNDYITKESLSLLTNLTGLGLAGNAMISGEVLALLPNLNALDISYTKDALVTDEQLRACTNLTYLDHCDHEFISDEGIRDLTKLTALFFENVEYVSDRGLSCLTSLTAVILNENITDGSIKHLTGLTALELHDNFLGITDVGLSGLTNLRSLNLTSHPKITNDCVSRLTNLTALGLAGNKNITVRGLEGLTKLCELHLEESNVTSLNQSLPSNVKRSHMKAVNEFITPLGR